MEQHEILRQKLNRSLEWWSKCLPCSCVPYRGDDTKSYHWDSCPWSGFLNGFHAAAEAVGVDPDSLEAFKIHGED